MGKSKPKDQMAAVAVPSSYPSLGPGPAPVPATGKYYVGAHISAAGGIFNVFENADNISAKSFAMFNRNQRQWNAKPFDDTHIQKYKELAKGRAPHLVLPHGSYLMNVGSCKPDLLQKSRDLLLDEMRRCNALGIPHFNFHPGSCVGGVSREECCRTIAASINQAHRAVPTVILVLENMCRQGNTIGGDFHELRLIISLVEDKSRVGVCIDTCHAHNAGYDLGSEEGFNKLIEEFEKIIGFQFLRGLHINDSKNEAGAHVDRHEQIGKGHIGIEGMRRVMNCPRFTDLPLILETPFVDDAGYAREIRLLEGLVEDPDKVAQGMWGESGGVAEGEDVKVEARVVAGAGKVKAERGGKGAKAGKKAAASVKKEVKEELEDVQSGVNGKKSTAEKKGKGKSAAGKHRQEGVSSKMKSKKSSVSVQAANAKVEVKEELDSEPNKNGIKLEKVEVKTEGSNENVDPIHASEKASKKNSSIEAKGPTDKKRKRSMEDITSYFTVKKIQLSDDA